MRAILKKLLIAILIILLLNNFIMNTSFASDAVTDKLESLVGSFVGLLTFPIRLVALGAGRAMDALIANVAYIEGATDGASVNTNVITPFDIFFNKVKILDINFFDIGTDDSIVTRIRTSIAAWYYVLRNLAAAILLVILIYVGIRMAISTVASDKAMYKKMLVDWVASLALIFVMQYIMIFAITVNNTIINALSTGVDSDKISNAYKLIRDLAFKITDLDSVAATVIYCMLVFQTFGLVISYFNRMLKLAFLVIISPLITLTYSIDKMGDGKAQALGAWLKEFVYTILIQPFHCIIYMCFIDVAFNLLITNTTADRSTLAVAVISILCVHSVKEGEKLVRKIFSFKDENSSTSMTAGLAAAGVALSQSKNIGKSARSMVNGVKTTKGALSAGIKSAKVGTLALGAKIANIGNEDAKGKTLAEYRSDVRTNMNNKKAEKMESKKYYRKNVTTSDAIKAETKRIADTGVSQKEAESIARLNVAKRERNQNGKVRKHITKAKGRISKVRDVIDHSDTLKFVGNLSKTYASAGMGLMVGSGVYGTSGNLFTAIGAGAAMYRGTQEFQKTAGTLETGTLDNLKGLGVKDQTGAALELDKILSNPSLFDGSSDASTEKMKELLDKVGKALEAAGVDAKYKTHIKNTIEGGIRANPAQSQRIVKDALNGLMYTGRKDSLDPNSEDITVTGVTSDSSQTPLSEVNNGALLDATQDLADFINRKQIYQQVQIAGNFNITADTYAGDVISRFSDSGPNYSEQIVDEGMKDVVDTNGNVEVTTADEFENNREEIDRQTSGLTNEQIEQLDREFENRKEEYRRQASNSDLSVDAQKTAADVVRQLEKEQTDIIARALADSDRDLTTISKKLVDKYEDKLAEALKEAETELKEAEGNLKEQEKQYSARTKGVNKQTVQNAGNKVNLTTAKMDRLQKTSDMWKDNIG
jgi:hypothetical protein